MMGRLIAGLAFSVLFCDFKAEAQTPPNTRDGRSAIYVTLNSLDFRRIDSRTDEFMIAFSGLNDRSLAPGSCVRFVMQDRGGAYWAQEAEMTLDQNSRSAEIRVGRGSAYPLRVSLVVGQADLCTEMANSRQTGRQIEPNMRERLMGSIVSNVCSASFMPADTTRIVPYCGPPGVGR